MAIFAFSLGRFTCLRWWSILLIERYLAAKFGTIFLVWYGGSSLLSVVEVVLFLFWLL
jgi:hypothetical protein